MAGRPLIVQPSTASSGAVARSAGLVVVNDADTGWPSARFSASPVSGEMSRPAFWSMSTMRSLPARLTCPAGGIGRAASNSTFAPPRGRTTTLPSREFQMTWASRSTVNTRAPSTYSE